MIPRKPKDMATKRFVSTLVSLMLMVSAFAAEKNLEKDITMVSYEQSWLDSNGTLALRNNTSEEIHNLVFLITYLDMAGQELDYREFDREISIDAHRTRKVDIPAYEHSRNYHYYRSEGMGGSNSPAFKIKFQLKDYNVGEDEADVEPLPEEIFPDVKNSGNDYMEDVVIVLSLFAAFLFIVGLFTGLYMLVALMAKNRNRNAAAWVFLSIVATPLLILIILLVIGKGRNKGPIA